MRPFEHRLAARDEDVPVARHALQRWLESSHVEPEAMYDVLVVASELVTNGVLHGGGRSITLRAWQEPGFLGLEVSTVERPAGDGAIDLRDPVEAGRGLAIVGGLAEQFRVELQGLLRVVSCHVPL